MEPTLADLVVQDTLRLKPRLTDYTSRSVNALRSSMISARRFVLDDNMAAFMADLATVPFKANDHRKHEVLDAMRHGARLPHSKVWIEYPGHPFRSRLLALGESKMLTVNETPEGTVRDMAVTKPRDAYGNELVGADETPARWGFLLETHPENYSAVKVREFTILPTMEGVPGGIVTLPWEWCYNSVDAPLPWYNADKVAGMFGHGITPYVSPYTGVTYEDSGLLPKKFSTRVELPDGSVHQVHKLVIETTGVLRYLFAFLATLNDAPVETSTVHPAGTYAAKGKRHGFLHHTFVRLILPKTASPQKTALKLVVAARRRAHQVRGHWRVLVHDVEPCSTVAGHRWWKVIDENHQACSQCGARRVWIAEHSRGDVALGSIHREFKVGHKPPVH